MGLGPRYAAGMSEPIGLVSLDPSAVWTSAPLSPGARVVLLLHGLGGDEADIATLAPAFPPGYVYVALRGPFPSDQGWAWTERDIDPARPGRINASAQAVEDWLATLDGVTCVGAVGFSQGAIVALQLMRRDPDRLGWVVQLSGGPFPMEMDGDAVLAQRRPPVFWGHGGSDPTLPADAEDWVRDWMTAHTEVYEVRIPDLGHDVDDEMAAAAAAFIAARR